MLPDSFALALRACRRQYSQLLLKKVLAQPPLPEACLQASCRQQRLNKFRRDFPLPCLKVANNGSGLQCSPVSLQHFCSGRDLIVEQLHRLERQRQSSALMLEIGCFLGGSSKLWLNATSHMTLIALDPWPTNYVDQLDQLLASAQTAHVLSHLDADALSGLRALLDQYGSYGFICQAFHGQERFIPWRGRSPDALVSLYARKIYPDVIYFDADKCVFDIHIARHLFPKSLIGGDDLLWQDRQGDNAFANQLHALTAEIGGPSLSICYHRLSCWRHPELLQMRLSSISNSIHLCYFIPAFSVIALIPLPTGFVRAHWSSILRMCCVS